MSDTAWYWIPLYHLDFGRSGGKDITFMGLKPEGIGSLFLNLPVCRNVTVTSSLKNMREAEAWLTYIGLSSSKRLLIGQRKAQKLNHSQWKKEWWAREKHTWTHYSFKEEAKPKQRQLISEEQQRRFNRSSVKQDIVG